MTSKSNNTQTQVQTISYYLSNRVATASMTAQATGVPHKNICRFKRDLEKSGQLVEVRKGICEVTKFRAWYITCDPSQFPKGNQLTLL